MVLYPETLPEPRIRRLERLLRFSVPTMIVLALLSLVMSVATVYLVPDALLASALMDVTLVAVLVPYLVYARRFRAHLQRMRLALEGTLT